MGRASCELSPIVDASRAPFGAVLLIPSPNRPLSILGLHLKKNGLETHEVPFTGLGDAGIESTLQAAEALAAEVAERFPSTLFAVGSEQGGVVASRLRRPRFVVALGAPLRDDRRVRFSGGLSIFPHTNGVDLEGSPYVHPHFDSIGVTDLKVDLADDPKVHELVLKEIMAKEPVILTTGRRESSINVPDEPLKVNPSLLQFANMAEQLAYYARERRGSDV